MVSSGRAIIISFTTLSGPGAFFLLSDFTTSWNMTGSLMQSCSVSPLPGLAVESSWKSLGHGYGYLGSLGSFWPGGEGDSGALSVSPICRPVSCLISSRSTSTFPVVVLMALRSPFMLSRSAGCMTSLFPSFSFVVSISLCRSVLFCCPSFACVLSMLAICRLVLSSMLLIRSMYSITSSYGISSSHSSSMALLAACCPWGICALLFVSLGLSPFVSVSAST